MNTCIKCGADALIGSKLCRAHFDGITKPVSEKTRLKYEAKYLRGQIRQRKALLRQKEQVTQLKAVLSSLDQKLAEPIRPF